MYPVYKRQRFLKGNGLDTQPLFLWIITTTTLFCLSLLRLKAQVRAVGSILPGMGKYGTILRHVAPHSEILAAGLSL